MQILSKKQIFKPQSSLNKSLDKEYHTFITGKAESVKMFYLLCGWEDKELGWEDSIEIR